MGDEPNPQAMFSQMYWDARRLENRGRKDEAKAAYSAAATYARQNSLQGEALVVDALALALDNALERAESTLADALDHHALRLPSLAWFARGTLCDKRGDHDQAIAAYREALQLPDFDWPSHAWINMGNAYAAKKDYDQALECYRKALAVPNFETPGKAWKNMADTYAEKKDYDQAVECYRNALAAPNHDAPGDTWNNMGAAYAAKKDYDQAVECYGNALAAPSYDTPGNAWSNMGLAYGGKKDYDQAIECYRKALAAPNYDTPGKAWYSMGNAYAAKKDYDQAIGCYRNAVAAPNCDTSGDAWNNMGAAYAAKKDNEQAIECYRKALAAPNYDKPGTAWSNMGVAYAEKKDYDHAIECCRKALAAPNRDEPGYAWYSMGNAYAEKKDYDQALDCYRNALAAPNYDKPGYAWYSMGVTFAQKEELDRAVECWTKAVPLLRERRENDWAERAEQMIAAATVTAGRRSRKDEATLAAQPAATAAERDSRPEDRIKAKLAATDRTKYEAYGRRYSAKDREPDVLAVLRGWGSAVSLLGEAGAASRGGGYLLKWRGKGVAIDPGFDFLNNLHDAGFHCREINAVIVSHNHTDHNDDLRTFDDIRYEMYKRAAADEKQAWKYVLLWDRDTAGREPFDPEIADHRFPHPQIMESHEEGWSPRPHTLPGLPFCVSHFKAKHSTNVPHALGIRIGCLNDDGTTVATVGFSCDTGFFPELCDDDHLAGCDILVAHISQPDPEEYDDPDHVKQRHLGYRGVASLICGCKPKLTLVGEFWAGMADLRIDLVHGLRALCPNNAILPASIGLQIRPDSREVRCTNCRKWCPLAEIQVGSPSTEFGPLNYLCRNCRLE